MSTAAENGHKHARSKLVFLKVQTIRKVKINSVPLYCTNDTRTNILPKYISYFQTKTTLLQQLCDLNHQMNLMRGNLCSCVYNDLHHDRNSELLGVSHGRAVELKR